MAEFGLPSTQLQDAKGEGANILSPVHTPATTANPLLPFVETVVDIFGKGLKQDAAAEAKRKETELVSRYIREQNKLSSAVDSGGMEIREAGVRSRATYTEFINNYPEYRDALDKAASTLRSNTALGEIEQEDKSKRDQHRKDIEAASKAGIVFHPGMSMQAERASVAAHKESVKAEQEMRDFYQREEYKRSQGRYDRELSEKQAKEKSSELVHKIAGANIEDLIASGTDISSLVNSGKMKLPEARALLMTKMARIEAALTAGGEYAPELASSYRSVFSKIQVTNEKLLDPKANAEDLKAQRDNLIYQAQLMAMQKDKKLLGIAATEGLIPAISANLGLATQTAREAVMFIANTTFSEDAKVPQVVGHYDPEAEREILDQIKKALKPVGDNPSIKKALAESEQANSVNHILKQVSSLANSGRVTPQQLEPVAKFIASPEFGAWANKKTFDPDVAVMATRALQVFEEAAISSVNQKLKGIVGISDYKKAAKSAETSTDGLVKLSDTVSVVFNTSGITFLPKATKLAPSEQRDQAGQMQALKEASAGINMLIKLEAHGSGSLDYAAVWEKNKHIYLPDIFPAPAPSNKPVKATTEADVKAAVQLTPKEQAKSDAYEKSGANIRELKAEIAKTTSPAIKAILEAELKKLGG